MELKAFVMSDGEVARVTVWIREHDLECPIRSQGSIPGKFTYSFTPNSLGLVKKVTCACGQLIDLTDYESW